jgi:2-oxoisovalerate dehydrogenase E2 component (dihydrolipoyl transacylase)
MKHFKLPDLGEGLQEADIVEWHIEAGQSVQADQIIVSVETAKAIVDIPSPCTGIIERLHHNAGDTVHIGEILVEFVGEDEDHGTVVGKVEHHPDALIEDSSCQMPDAVRMAVTRALATPAVRLLARERGVDIERLQGSGKDGMVTLDDVEQAHARSKPGPEDQHVFPSARGGHGGATPAGTVRGEVLKGARKRMAQAMTMAHAEVVKVTLCEDVDIEAWRPGRDPTLRLMRALIAGCRSVPACNAWFDGNTLQLEQREAIDLGIAIDTPDGLFVPVLRNAGQRSDEDLREQLDQLRAGVRDRSLPPSAFTGATISLSNFGTLAGRYADPVVVPPMVVIVGAGRIRPQVVALNGEAVVHRTLPLSLSFDHRALTGGEAARFLRTMMDDLAQPL